MTINIHKAIGKLSIIPRIFVLPHMNYCGTYVFIERFGYTLKIP